MKCKLLWRSENAVPAHWLVVDEDGVPHLYTMREKAKSPDELVIETIFDAPANTSEYWKALNARSFGLDVQLPALERKVWTTRDGTPIPPMSEQEFRAAAWQLLLGARGGTKSSWGNMLNIVDTTDEQDDAAGVSTHGSYGIGGGSLMIVEAPSDHEPDASGEFRAWRYEWNFEGKEVPYSLEVARQIGAPELHGYRKAALARAAQQAEEEMRERTESRQRQARELAIEFGVAAPAWCR